MNSRSCMWPGQQGSVLVITLLVLFSISIIGATLAMVSSMELKISGNQRRTTQSLFVAEAGLSEAIHRLSLPDPTVVTVGGWTGNAAITDSEPYDPDWTTMIYLTSPASAPAGSGSIVRTGTLQDLTQPHLVYSASSGTADVITIQHKWVDRDGDSVRDPDEIVRYDKFSVPPENFANGNPVEIVTVTGQSADGKSTIVAEVTKKTMTVRTLGALYVDRPVTLTGDCAFCGYNHSYDTPIGYRPAGSGSSSGSGPGGGGSGGSGGSASAGDCEDYHLAGGHLSGVTGTGAQIQTQGSTCIMGDPAPINNSSSNPFYGLNEVLGMPSNEVQEMLAKADNTGIVNPLNGITYIQGNASIMSNLSGEGLVYITGDLHASGKFDFKGLIYVEGDVHLSGSPWILGSLIVRGITDFNFSAGHATVLYSSEALTRSLNNSMPAMVLSWKEM